MGVDLVIFRTLVYQALKKVLLWYDESHTHGQLRTVKTANPPKNAISRRIIFYHFLVKEVS